MHDHIELAHPLLALPAQRQRNRVACAKLHLAAIGMGISMRPLMKWHNSDQVLRSAAKRPGVHSQTPISTRPSAEVNSSTEGSYWSPQGWSVSVKGFQRYLGKRVEGGKVDHRGLSLGKVLRMP